MSAITDAALQAAPAAPARGYWATVGRRIRRDKVSMVCAFILVLALFFVALNLLVDIAQASIDPRIKRS